MYNRYAFLFFIKNDKKMKYDELENALFKQKPVFNAKDIKLAGFKVFPYQFNYWIKEGKIRKLANGFYTFTKAEVKTEHIANLLRQPSYVSLQYALYYYNLIVDIPFHITSVTTKNTRKVKVGDAIYFYQQVKPSLFNGFTVVENKGKLPGQSFLIATPEKALVDLFYLNPTRLKVESDFDEARFHEDEMKKKIDWRGVFDIAALYKNKNLEKRLYDFKNYIFSR